MAIVNFNLVLFIVVGASAEDRKSELAKLRSLSSKFYREDIVNAAKRTFCYRQVLLQQKKPSFAECVAGIPCYATLPQIVRSR
jgi:hypothetical protein